MSVLVKNVSGEAIPPYAIMLATGVERLTNERVALKVDLYVSDNEAEILLVNGGTEIGITGSKRYGHGEIVHYEPFWVAYDSSSGTPAFGETWGVEDDTWILAKDVGGFTILGLPDAEAERVLCVRDLTIQVRDAIVGNPAMTSADNAKTGATTGNATFLVPDPNSPGDLMDGDTFEFTNRSVDADATTGTYMVVVSIGNEHRPIWVDC